MRSFLARFLCALTVLLLCSASTIPVLAEEKPLLSAEIQKTLDADGIEAAQRRFDELFPSQKEKYQIDMNGFAQMAMTYMKAGDMTTGQAILEMSAALTRDAISGANVPGAQTPAAPPAAKQPEPDPVQGYDSGPSRKDLERFVGLYSDPQKPDELRSLFATVSCDGRLVVGATWGDAQNWWMKSVGDTAFEYSDSFTKLKLQFQTGPDGKAVSMNHDLEFMPKPLKRIGPLPEQWGSDCIEPPRR
jgi:hypothetical protein